MSLATRAQPRPADAFRHEALFYRGDEEFLDATSSFIREGVAAREPTLVVVDKAKIDQLRRRLGPDAAAVSFADMAEVGRNPARIIPAWRDFVDHHASAGRRLRGIGEPIGPDRRGAELVECHHHETLLNVAFADAPAWWLLCPYDAARLDADVIEEARRTHPFFVEDGRQYESADYRGQSVTVPFDDALPAPPPGTPELPFDITAPLPEVRRSVADHAAAAGMSPARIADLVLAVNELVTNSLRHGGGRGVLRNWVDRTTFLCEVRDRGRFRRPLAGRQRPPRSENGGRGLWLVNQMCDLVQLRSTPDGTVVRVHMALR